MIPPEKRVAVFRGPHQAFGATAIGDIRALPKGLSSDFVFRIAVHGFAYLMRIVKRISESMDPGRIFASMRAARLGCATATRKTGF